MARERPAPVVLVVGMHRSGTSLLARVVNMCGVAVDPEQDMQSGDNFNVHGYFEPIYLVHANDELIDTHGGTWYTPPVARLQQPVVSDALRGEMRARVESWRERKVSWLWKDPRLTVTLPAWQIWLPPQVVLVAMRNPVAVARSLAARDATPSRLAYLMWEVYTRAAVYNTRHAIARTVIGYEDLVDRPAATLERVSRFLDASGVVLEGAPRVGAARAHVMAAHRHHSADVAGFRADAAATPAQKALFQMRSDELLLYGGGWDELYAAQQSLHAARGELEAGIRAAWNENHYAMR